MSEGILHANRPGSDRCRGPRVPEKNRGPVRTPGSVPKLAGRRDKSRAEGCRSISRDCRGSRLKSRVLFPWPVYAACDRVLPRILRERRLYRCSCDLILGTSTRNSSAMGKHILPGWVANKIVIYDD